MSEPDAMDLLLTGAEVWTGSGLEPLYVAIRGGRIAALGGGAPPPARSTLDLPGRWLLPGMIDTHVHFREPGGTLKEDFGTGTAAAAAGGVTTVLEIQNNVPLTTDRATLDAKLALVSPKARVNFGLYANVGIGNLNELAAMAPDVVAFKVFMTQSVGPLTVTGVGDLWEVFRAVRGTGRPLAVHAESDAICRTARSAGLPREAASHIRSRPALAESIAVAEALELCAATGTPMNLPHLSTARAVELVAEAKRRGLPVSAATCPHYLIATDEDAAREGSLFVVNPAIKSADDRAALLEGLRTGVIDHVHSDHAPHTREEKAQAWPECPSGIAGIQHQLPILMDLHSRGELPLRDLVRAIGPAPATAFGLRERGRLEIGFHADLVALDPAGETVVGEDLRSRAGTSPWSGRSFRGRVDTTIVGGQVVVRGSELQDLQPGGHRVEAAFDPTALGLLR